jgi:hypothetical protein
MIEPIRERAQCQCRDAPTRFIAGRPIGDHAGQDGDLADPAPVILEFEVNLQQVAFPKWSKAR